VLVGIAGRGVDEPVIVAGGGDQVAGSSHAWSSPPEARGQSGSLRVWTADCPRRVPCLVDIEASHSQSLSWQGHSCEPASHEALVDLDLPVGDGDLDLVVALHPEPQAIRRRLTHQASGWAKDRLGRRPPSTVHGTLALLNVTNAPRTCLTPGVYAGLGV
jgi:hypothetical protein